MNSPGLAYLLKKFPRTSETFILNELLGLQAHGTTPHVFSRRPPDDEPRHPELEGLRAPVEVLPASKEIDPWTSLFGDGADDALRDGVRAAVASFGPLGHPRFPSLLAEAVHLWHRCRALCLSHVHSHFGTDSAVVACLLRILGGPSYSLTLHAKDIYRNTVDRAILSRLVGDSAFAVTVCDANLRYLRQLLPPAAAARVRRLYNGVDLAALAAAEGAREPGLVLAVGRLVEKKGFDLLLEALARLAPSGCWSRAIVVGEGEDGARLAALAAERGLQRQVVFAGALPADAVRALMGRASVLALPCRVGEDGNRDALPTVLLEALAAGLPAVSTPVTGIPEILDAGRAGVLVREGDVEDLARALRQVLSDEPLRARLAAAGRRRAAALFDGHSNTRVLHEWLRQAAQAPVPA